MRTVPSFDAQIQLRRDEVVVRLRGRLGRHAQRLLDACIASACNATRADVVVDLTEVRTYDDEGFDMMAAAIGACRARGLNVKIVGGEHSDD
jgi:anti-anti-sigma regulatory factor